jgi:hypothetical protein
MDALLARLRAYPQFREIRSDEAIIIVGTRVVADELDQAQEPQDTEIAQDQDAKPGIVMA